MDDLQIRTLFAPGGFIALCWPFLEQIEQTDSTDFVVWVTKRNGIIIIRLSRVLLDDPLCCWK